MNLTRAIGVSNYAEADLKALDGVKPSVNQCSMSLQKWDKETLDYCNANHIRYESYHGMKGCPFTNADVKSVAAAHNVSTAQVCFRWVLEKGAVIAGGTGSDPSTAAAYAKENLDIYGFQLTQEEIATLDKIGS
jgi:diketogulonate reductase-like aldo/keto reductase